MFSAAFDVVQVAVAHTTGRHLDQHFPRPRWVQVHLFHPQRLVLGVKDCCFHFSALLLGMSKYG